MSQREAVRQFVEKTTLAKLDRVADDADLFLKIRLHGDDVSELMEAFASTFGIDMSNYLWYFHHTEEGSAGPGAIFFKPPYARVDPIPITLNVLYEAAETKRWPIRYPEHELPKERLDLKINSVVFIAIGIISAAVLLHSCLRKISPALG